VAFVITAGFAAQPFKTFFDYDRDHHKCGNWNLSDSFEGNAGEIFQA
jgi:hypothetical protein